MPIREHLAPAAYRTVLEDLPAAVYLVDREGTIALWNAGCERVTGLLRHEVIGRPFSGEIVNYCDHDGRPAPAPLLETSRDGHCREAHLFLRHREGHRVPVRVRSFAAREDEGGSLGTAECIDEHTVVLPVRQRAALVEAGGLDRDLEDLPAEHAILNRLEAELQELQRVQIPFGLICLGLANPEALRGSKGGLAVDKAYLTTSRTLRRILGPQSFLGWTAGHRFVATIPGCRRASLNDTAFMLTRLCSAEAVPWWGGELSVLWRAGGTMARPEDSPGGLLERAGLALHLSEENKESPVAVI